MASWLTVQHYGCYVADLRSELEPHVVTALQATR
jgi:hypothetical protein